MIIMKKLLLYLKRIWIINMSYLLTYRTNFYNEILNAFIWGSFSFISIFLLTTRTTYIYGWTREELYVLTGSFGIIYGLFSVFMIRNMNRFEFVIDHGLLDYHLLKPIDAQITLSTWVINYSATIRVLIGLLIVFVYGAKLHLIINVWTITGYVFLLVFGVLILYSIWFISAIVLIYNPRLSNIIEVMYTVSNIAKYPPEMFSGVKYILFFFMPLTIIIATPTKLLLQRILLGDVFWLVICSIAMFYLTRRLWTFALRHYTSAN